MQIFFTLKSLKASPCLGYVDFRVAKVDILWMAEAVTVEVDVEMEEMAEWTVGMVSQETRKIAQVEWEADSILRPSRIYLSTTNYWLQRSSKFLPQK